MRITNQFFWCRDTLLKYPVNHTNCILRISLLLLPSLLLLQLFFYCPQPFGTDIEGSLNATVQKHYFYCAVSSFICYIISKNCDYSCEFIIEKIKFKKRFIAVFILEVSGGWEKNGSNKKQFVGFRGVVFFYLFIAVYFIFLF